jgi:hypothetical protein
MAQAFFLQKAKFSVHKIARSAQFVRSPSPAFSTAMIDLAEERCRIGATVGGVDLNATGALDGRKRQSSSAAAAQAQGLQ